MRKFSISDKLILASIALSIVTILIVASYSFFKAKDAILERTFNQLTSVRVVKTNLVEKFFSNCITEIELARSSSDIKEITSQIINIQSSTDYETIGDSLIKFNNPFIDEISKEYYSKISIIGNNKLIYDIKSIEIKDEDNIQDYEKLWESTVSSESSIIIDLEKKDSQKHKNITISSRITDFYNNPIGIIVFELSLDPINSIMLENDPSRGLGTSGESYLVGDDYLMRSKSRFQSNSILITEVKTEAVDSAFSGLYGTRIIQDYRDISVLSSYGKINVPNLNWVILAEIDYKEVTVPIYRIRNEIIFISIFIFIIVLIVVYVLSKKITYPIQRLNIAAKEIGEGNLNVELKSTSKDEIGDLTTTFNTMIDQLKIQKVEIKEERIKRLRSIIDGQEIERQRLSRELHDSLGQLLIGLKLKYESCLNQSKTDMSSNERFEDLGNLFDKTIDETRRISNNLMPAALSEFGLSTSIRNLCNEISESAKINITYNSEGSNAGLDIKVKTYIYRVIQEALTNILKHSDAKNAIINISFQTSVIILHIEDDGKGFDKASIKKLNTNGLNNIKDRISLLSGKFTITSEISKGTKINIEVPINHIKHGKN